MQVNQTTKGMEKKLVSQSKGEKQLHPENQI